MGGLICGSMVGHFWTFLLKPPQPLMGLFFQYPDGVMENVPIVYAAMFNMGAYIPDRDTSLALSGVNVHGKGHFEKPHVHRDIVQVNMLLRARCCTN